jgi:uncharacterized protein YggE
MIMSSWFDRPLSIAGRVIVRDETGVRTVLVNLNRDMTIIPNVAIHMNREVNNGYKYNAAVDTFPLWGSQEAKNTFKAEIAKAAGVEEKDVITSRFNVFSGVDYAYDSLGREKRTPYYEVQNTVTVTIHDLSLIGPVLDAAVEAGANNTYGIAFSSSQENEAYQKALTRAVQDAMLKAQVIAAAAGVELGDLISVNYNWKENNFTSPTFYGGSMKTLRANAATATMTISASTAKKRADSARSASSSWTARSMTTEPTWSWPSFSFWRARTRRRISACT